MTSRAPYYYDRETDEILKNVRYVDGDASREWDQSLTLLLRHLQPAVEVYLRTNLGSMFTSIVEQPPWTQALFPELLERHHRSFEECGAQRSSMHARNLKDLVRGRREAVPWLDTLRVVATVRSIVKRFPDEMPMDPDGWVTDAERQEASEKLLQGKQAISSHYYLIRDHILSYDRSPPERGYRSWDGRRDGPFNDDYGIRNLDIYEDGRGYDQSFNDRRDHSGYDRRENDAFDDRRMDIRDEAGYDFPHDDREDFMRRDHQSRYDIVRDDPCQERSPYPSRRNDDRGYGITRVDRGYGLEDIRDEHRRYDRRNGYDETERGHEWRRDDDRHDYGNDYGDRGGRGGSRSMQRSISDRYNDGFCERRGQTGHRLIDDRDPYDEGEQDGFGHGWNERFARVTEKDRRERKVRYDRGDPGWWNASRDVRLNERMESGYRDYQGNRIYRDDHQDYQQSGYLPSRGGREGYSGDNWMPPSDFQYRDDPYERNGRHGISPRDFFVEPIRADLPRRPPRRLPSHWPGRRYSGDGPLERDNWGSNGDHPRQTMRHEVRRRYDPPRNGFRSDRKSYDHRDGPTTKRRQNLNGQQSMNGNATFQRQESIPGSGNPVGNRTETRGWGTVHGEVQGGCGWGRSLTDRRRGNKSEVQSEHRQDSRVPKKTELENNASGPTGSISSGTTNGIELSEMIQKRGWSTSNPEAAKNQAATVFKTNNEGNGNSNPWISHSAMTPVGNPSGTEAKNPWLTLKVDRPIQDGQASERQAPISKSPWTMNTDHTTTESSSTAPLMQESSQAMQQNPWARKNPPLLEGSQDSKTATSMLQSPWTTKANSAPENTPTVQPSQAASQTAPQNPWLTPKIAQPIPVCRQSSEIEAQTSHQPRTRETSSSVSQQNDMTQQGLVETASLGSWVTPAQVPSSRQIQEEPSEVSIDQSHQWVTPITGSAVNPWLVPNVRANIQKSTKREEPEETPNPWTTKTMPEGSPWGPKSESAPPHVQPSTELPNAAIPAWTTHQAMDCTITQLNQTGSQILGTTSEDNPWTKASHTTGQSNPWTTTTTSSNTRQQEATPPFEGHPLSKQSSIPGKDPVMSEKTPSSSDASDVSSKTVDIPVPRTSATESEASPEPVAVVHEMSHQEHPLSLTGSSSELHQGDVVNKEENSSQSCTRADTVESTTTCTAPSAAKTASDIRTPLNDIRTQVSIERTTMQDSQGIGHEMPTWTVHTSEPVQGNPWIDKPLFPSSSFPTFPRTHAWIQPTSDRTVWNMSPSVSPWRVTEQSWKTETPIEAPSFNSKQHIDTISGEKFITGSSEQPSYLDGTPRSGNNNQRPPPGFEDRVRSESLKTGFKNEMAVESHGKAPMEGIEMFDEEGHKPPGFFIEED